ncbi:MAG: hypothetical protein ABSF92_10850 [Candidatus Acidiferrales bacterium]
MHSKAKNPILTTQVLLLAVLLSPAFASAQTPPVNATIDASKTGAPISKYLYGQFLEHGGNIVNENVWAEMLEDRKFYRPVTSKPQSSPPFRRGGVAPRSAIGRPLAATKS